MEMDKKLAQKLCVIMGAVGNIPKKGWNPNQKYAYAADADISEALRKAMAEVGVVMLPNVREHSYRTIKTSKGNDMTVNTVIMDYLFIDAETGESIPISTVGEGMDSGDKGVYKAMTGATKYALMKSFQISTGDDPENEVEQPKQQYSQPQTQPHTQPQARPQAIPKGGNWTGQDLMTFGKYKDSRWADADDNYLAWLIEKGTNDNYKAMARMEIERRSKEILDELGEEVDSDEQESY